VGFIVDDVEPGSVAAFLGCKCGDWVETVNEGNVVSLAEAIPRLDGARQVEKLAGTPVDGPDAYIAALLKAIDGAEVSFEVSRRRKTFGHVHQQVWDGDLNASVPGRWSAGRLHLTLRSPEPRTRPR
jgi:hypothetical protein